VSVLYLLRHAKSSWDDPELEDRDRPLAPRGRRASAHIAEHLRGDHVAPALVLCSSALRTRETLAAILPALEGELEIRIEDGLYGAGVDALLARLNDVPDPVHSVLLIGHNPSIHELALTLAGRGDGLDRLRERFPTGALATLGIPTGGWSGLRPRAAVLEGFVLPRELEESAKPDPA
jgi:phosphohistidine phosphatase